MDTFYDVAKVGTAEDRIDGLFAVPGDEFVSARDALAKELKASGDKVGAAEVKKLRRPTVAAAALNWLARNATKDLDALVRLGDRLRDAHETLATGGDGSDVRRATADRRRRTAALTDRAVTHLGAAGEAQRTAITHTLDAAVADVEAAALVRSGRLSKELDAPSGFGAEITFAAATATPTPERRSDREDRRAARRARRVPVVEPVVESADEPEKIDLAALRAELRNEADNAVTSARAAAQEAKSARAEVARRQQDLIEAEAALHAAEERARLTQWKSVAAQNDLRHAAE